MKYLFEVTLVSTLAVSALAFAQSRQAPFPKSPLQHELTTTTPEQATPDAGVRDGGVR